MKNKWLAGFMICFIAVMVFAGIPSYAKTADDKIAMGIFLDEVNVSGLTKEEAIIAVNDYIAAKAEETIAFDIDGDLLDVSRGSLGIAWNNPEIVDEAVAVGKTGNLIRKYKEIKDLEFENKVYHLTYTADSEMIQTVVTEECTKFNKDAVDMGLEKTESGFVVLEGENGVVVDETAAVKTIHTYIENEFTGEAATIVIPVAVDQPQGSAEELAKVKDVLGTFKTAFKTSSANRSKNVSTGAGHINGTVLYPGETFSTYEVVSPFSVANGYAMAGSYLNGKTVESLGGGICQVSSTLYNAVLMAELEVVERSPHSMLVSYVQESADAAIAGTYKDFKFKNSTNAPIYIEGYTTADKQIVFTIYGQETRPANRTISYTNKIISTTPAATQLIADGAQGIGYRVVESGHNGCRAELYKNVYVDGKLESSEFVNKSNYMVSNRCVYYGVNGDPHVSAQLQNCIAAGDEAGANALIGR